ncbi:MAG: flavodoxin domain-containing protein [Spirochaetia bacterium]|nr:flavodoxin domain-containing protein [Spirochaetia bacterium]
MKTLIAYAGRNGSTQKMAERIAGQIGSEAELVNLLKQPAPEMTEYDNVILGGSILAGVVPKPLQKFIKQQKETLLSKRVHIFLCCLMEEQIDQYFSRNFPEPLYSHAEHKVWLGGELVLEDHNLIVRKMLKKITGTSEDIHSLSWAAADQLAAAAAAPTKE